MSTPYTGGGCLINHKDGIITISQFDETGYDNVIILNMDAAYDVAVFILRKYKPASKRHED